MCRAQGREGTRTSWLWEHGEEAPGPEERLGLQTYVARRSHPHGPRAWQLPGGASQEWSRWQDVLHRAGQGQRTEAVCVWARGHQTEEEARKKAASNVIY